MHYPKYGYFQISGLGLHCVAVLVTTHTVHNVREEWVDSGVLAI